MEGRCPRCGMRVGRGILTCPRCDARLEWTPLWPVGVVLAGAAAILASILLPWTHEVVRVPLEGGARQFIAFDQGLDLALALIIFASAVLAVVPMLGPRRFRILAAFAGAVGLATGITYLDPSSVSLAYEGSTLTPGPGVYLTIAGGLAVIVGALTSRRESVRAVGGYEPGTAMTGDPIDGVRLRYRLWAFELILPMLLAVRGYQVFVALAVMSVVAAVYVGGDFGLYLGVVGIALVIVAIAIPFVRGVHRPPVIVDVTPRGLAIEGNAVHVDIPWSQVAGVRRIARLYVLRTPTLGSVMVPVRAVTPEIRVRFETLLARRHEAPPESSTGHALTAEPASGLDGEPLFTTSYRFGRFDWVRISLELRLRAIAVIELTSLVFIGLGLTLAIVPAGGELSNWTARSLAGPVMAIGLVLAALPFLPLFIAAVMPQRTSHLNKPILMRLYATQVSMTIDGSDSVASWRAFTDATESRSFFRLRQLSPRRDVLIPKAGLTIDQQIAVRQVLREQHLLWSQAPKEGRGAQA